MIVSCEHIWREAFWQKIQLSNWSQEKVIHFLAKVQIMAIFDSLSPPSKSIFST